MDKKFFSDIVNGLIIINSQIAGSTPASSDNNYIYIIGCIFFCVVVSIGICTCICFPQILSSITQALTKTTPFQPAQSSQPDQLIQLK